MSLSIKGIIKGILPVESGTSKAGKDWKKGRFVLDTKAQYNPDICFSVFGEEKLEHLSKHKQGEEVEVHFNISSREYNGKYYHSVDAWKIEAVSQTIEQVTEVVETALNEEDDDLPF